jgi:hypothetical protein
MKLHFHVSLLVAASGAIAQNITYTLLAPGCGAIGAPNYQPAYPGWHPAGFWWTQHDPFFQGMYSTGATIDFVVIGFGSLPTPIPLPWTNWWSCFLSVQPDLILVNPWGPIIPYIPGAAIHIQGVTFWDGIIPPVGGFPGAIYPAYGSSTQAWRINT